MKHAGHTVVVILGVMVVAVAACSEGNGATACLPQDVERCQCDDGRAGYRVCDPDAGSGYGVCDCDLDASPDLPAAPDAAAPDAADGGSCGAMPLGYLCPCVSSDQCASGVCGVFPAKGNRCTMPCKTTSDCPPPSPGCNMMGVCKAP